MGGSSKVSFLGDAMVYLVMALLLWRLLMASSMSSLPGVDPRFLSYLPYLRLSSLLMRFLSSEDSFISYYNFSDYVFPTSTSRSPRPAPYNLLFSRRTSAIVSLSRCPTAGAAIGCSDHPRAGRAESACASPSAARTIVETC
jgi:hypothetical protein